MRLSVVDLKMLTWPLQHLLVRLPVFPGTLTEFELETLAEVELIAESALRCNFRQRHIGRNEQSRCLSQLTIQYVCFGGNAGGFLKNSMESGHRKRTDFCKH